MKTAAAALVLLLLLLPGLAVAADEPRPALGVALHDPADPLPDGSGLIVRLVARWDRIERETGRFDWSTLASRLEALRAAGHRPVLCLTGAHPAYPAPEGLPLAVEPWTAFVRAAVRDLGAWIEALEIWEAPDLDPRFDPVTYAYVLKASSIAARAAATAAGHRVAVAQGSVDAARLAWHEGVLAAGAAPYIDVLPVRASGSDPEAGAAASRAAFEVAVRYPPAARIWAVLEGGESAARFAAALQALGAGARAALGDGPAPAWAVGVQRVLDQGYAATLPGTLAVVDAAGEPRAGPRILGRFVHERDLTTLVAYTHPDGPGAGVTEALLVLDVPDARDVRVIDPVTGYLRSSASGALPDGSGRRAVGILFREHPMLVRYRRASLEELEIREGGLDVAAARGLTAAEIIALHQEVQRAQDDRLERWTARGRIEFHFKLAQAGSTVDVGIDCTYFWSRDGALEWEQSGYWVNGNRVNWKDFPEIPFVQPERVATLPLDLTLDRRYAYELVGEDDVDGRPAWVLSFEPADPGAPLSLYRGRVWIDRATFVRLRTRLTQTNLEAPVLSNEETDAFTPVVGADGSSWWLLTSTQGQQLWTVAGRNLVVTRELTLSDFEINPARDAFEARRAAAYASKNQMLRDTPQGFRYLERRPDGGREEKKADPSQWFAAAGAYKDASLDSVVPLAGVNYFNFDVAGKGIQTNVFFAGVLVFANATWPDLFGKRLDGAAETALSAIESTDKIFENGDEIENERVQFRDPSLSVRLGIPLTTFVKATLAGDLAFLNYSAADATDPAFVLPADHRVATASLVLEWNRRGTSLALTGSVSKRSDWRPWGIPDATTGAYPDYDPSHDTFAALRATAFHEWYLPRFQKLRLDGSWFEGRDMDRFSQFRFSLFGDDRLSGFAGSGVRFERGGIVRGGYSFNAFGVVRLDVTLESARIRADGTGGVDDRFTGAGLSANFPIPWKTVIALSYGRALDSAIPQIEGQGEFFLTAFKLF
jgi:hypothetical protein